MYKFKEFKNHIMFKEAESISLLIRDKSIHISYQDDNDQYDDYYVMSAILYSNKDLEVILVDSESAKEICDSNSYVYTMSPNFLKPNNFKEEEVNV